MTEMFLARALHVLGVVIWIGGVSMASTVFLPAVRKGAFGPDKLEVFQAVERRFIWQARAAVLVVGITGLYMIEEFGLWSRFTDAAYWWMHAMVIVWTLFVFVVFIGEPFVLRRFFPIWATREPERAFAWLHRVHLFLMTLSFITVLGAVAGAHGMQF
ncbi:MAG: hypothetical protein R3E09_06100 [Novosphingobium sp.]|nr:hypothetical protein [Novosphingobium sp.]